MHTYIPIFGGLKVPLPLNCEVVIVDSGVIGEPCERLFIVVIGEANKFEFSTCALEVELHTFAGKIEDVIHW